MGKTRIHQQIVDEIGGDLEPEHLRPSAGDPNSRDPLTHLVGPDPGALDRVPDST